MKAQGEKVVLREGRDWMELRGIGPERSLWLVTGGTVGMSGDIVRVPRLEWVDPNGDSDAADGVSPFEAEIVVDSLTKAVLLPYSAEPSTPLSGVFGLMLTLREAGLAAQAKIVWDWLRTTNRGKNAQRDAA